MKLYEFIALNETEQANSVWNGVFLETRVDGSFNILLYDLGGFYVEVYYHVGLNKIDRLRPFKKVSNLNPYLDEINGAEIDELL